jgi:hypothetical protein
MNKQQIVHLSLATAVACALGANTAWGWGEPADQAPGWGAGSSSWGGGYGSEQPRERGGWGSGDSGWGSSASQADRPNYGWGNPKPNIPRNLPENQPRNAPRNSPWAPWTRGRRYYPGACLSRLSPAPT